MRRQLPELPNECIRMGGIETKSSGHSMPTV
jgi:hypothetical protein